MAKKIKNPRKKLLEEISGLSSEREKVFLKVQELRNKYTQLLKEYQPQINILQIQADDLASRFRKLYKESQEAHEAGDGALAKALSIEGHKLQDECEELNKQANAMRRELKAILDEIERCRQRMQTLETKTSANKEKLTAFRPTTITSFDKSQILNDSEIQDFLDEFPTKALKEIQSLQYNDHFLGDRTKTRTGITRWDKKTGKALIDIYRHPFQTVAPKEKIIDDTKRTITHEIGHVVFEKFMADTERWQWGEWYRESMEKDNFITSESEPSRADDFCECFAEFKINPTKKT